MKYLVVLIIFFLASCELQFVVIKGSKNDIHLEEREDIKLDSIKLKK